MFAPSTMSFSSDGEGILLTLQRMSTQASQQGDQGFCELLIWDLQTLKRALSGKMPGAFGNTEIFLRIT